jgi:hypothetical protein
MFMIMVWNYVKGCFSSLIGVETKYPWQFCAAILAIFGAYEYHENHKHIATLNANKLAGELQAKKDVVNAQNAQTDFQTLSQPSDDILAAYARAHPVFVRVPTVSGKAATNSTISAIAASDPKLAAGSEISVNLSTISHGDLKTCDEDYIYAKAAYDFLHPVE